MLYIWVPEHVCQLWFVINSILLKIYVNFTIRVKEVHNRIFWDITGVRIDDRSEPITFVNGIANITELWQVFKQETILFTTLLITWTDGIANITELWQVFKLMTIIFRVLLVTWTDGTANFTNHFNSFCFSCSSQLIQCSMLHSIKWNISIKCYNCNYCAPQN